MWAGSSIIDIVSITILVGMQNPYVLSTDPCGSSSGSAISTATNMVAVSLGTETDGSLLCLASFNSIVAIKPTVGLTSRDQVIPVSPRQDTVRSLARTVSDAVYVLDAIVGPDHNDPETIPGSKYIPHGGFKQYLNCYGLKGKRLGIVRNPFFGLLNNTNITLIFQKHFQTLREEGATIVDNLEIASINTILNPNASGESEALFAEFKLSLNAYLKNLVVSPVRSLSDIIAFNIKNAR
ncbi:hypothetical protein QN277_028692 [Acacia crassicarpa]|uniref:Amidase domain-containing protein n=1 Tax=Acacia crassicarpa TaxID=499986 RepID=A0AAE1K3R6_9FABA|nr:hypothetical protein QN277_028692 [Acacia crassicarpa]